MQNTLTYMDKMLTKLGPVTHMLDTLAERVLPKANAQAVCVFCGSPYCSNVRCGNLFALWQDCFDNCTHTKWTANLGCSC